jgi:UTP--glucose-1-phosphate uridylyltransferase
VDRAGNLIGQGESAMTESERTETMAEFRAKMAAEDLPELAIDTFVYYYRKLVAGEKGLIADQEIDAVSPEEIAAYEQLTAFETAGRERFGQTVMIRLNGGLGTSMGLQGPKSLIEVKEGRSFLEIIVGQAQSQGAQLCLMNSFNTQADTEAALANMGVDPAPRLFLQNKFPKVLQKELTPASWPQNPDLEWNPPGHGDIFTALHTSGLLDALLAEGVRYAFIANSDNLGASLDETLLGYFIDQQASFMMEVAQKTPSDIKGGHLARLKENGRLLLRESAQCPEDELDAFRDIVRYGYFNTNNIWIRLDALSALIAERGLLELPMIVNPKTLDPRDPDSPPVYQIESAMGAAISLFDNALAVQVPRSRFMPVKKCADLLAVRSDCYKLLPDWQLKVDPACRFGPPKLDLDDRYYKKIDDFEARFPAGVPSLLNCSALKVEGDVRFEADVIVEGHVTVFNRHHQQAVVARGRRLNGEVNLEP